MVHPDTVSALLQNLQLPAVFLRADCFYMHPAFSAVLLSLLPPDLAPVLIPAQLCGDYPEDTSEPDLQNIRYPAVFSVC